MKKEILSQAYSRDSFVRFATDFLPEDFAPDNAVVSLPGNPNFTTEISRLGKCRSLELEVFEFRHSSMRDARVGICKDAFSTLLHQSNYNRALIAFVPSDCKQWRLSLLEMDAEINDRTNRIKRNYSNPRRYSFILGVDTKVKTPIQFIVEKGRVTERSENGKPITAWDDMKSRFSVEVLTKDFYSQIYRWFLWALDDRSGVYFPNDIYTSDDDFDRKPERIIRLITRLLFVWFVKQKGLIPEEIFRIKDLNDILSDFNPQSTTESNYYNAILQNLFFATLNQEADKRAFINDYKNIEDKWSVKDLYRDDTRKSYFNPDYGHDRILHLFHKVPFMNSGLFDCLDTFKLNDEGRLVADMFYDGFTSNGVLDAKTRRFKRRAFIPNMLFFAPEHEESVTTNRTEHEHTDLKVQGIINIFEEYNFTIEENTPQDVHVSLDPELLGRVFEELLAAYDPETGTTLRKATGSFYTPREIVDYMVEESIIAHLSHLFPDKNDEIRKLVKHQDLSVESVCSLPKDEIIESLYSIKILDPACGSGAFPMGCLLKICNIIQTLDPDGYDSYNTKLHIIQNCIYGVDIQPVAMLITKLRFFISLLCEQTPDLSNSKANFGINPLPNLDTRFVAANTLLPPDIKKFDNDAWNDERLVELREELFQIRAKMFSSRTKETNRKYKKDDLEKRNEIKRYICSKYSGPDSGKIKLLYKQIEQYKKELETCKDENWQDETAAQASLFGDVPQSIFSKDFNKLRRTRLQRNIAECQRKIDQENLNALGDDFDRAISQVTEWDPFDQNMSSPFFDSEWMFGVKDGFDIVIGNPPYMFLSGKGSPVQRLKNEGKIAKAHEMQLLLDKYSSQYPDVSIGCKDFYKWFFKLALNSAKDGGIVVYITPDTFINMPKYRDLRIALFSHEALFSHDLGFNVFDTPTVSTAISMFRKGTANKEVLYSDIKLLLNKSNKSLLYSLIVDNARYVPIEDYEVVAYKHPLAAHIYDSKSNVVVSNYLRFVEGEHKIHIDGQELFKQECNGTIPVLVDSMLERNGYVPVYYIKSECEISDIHKGVRAILRKTGDTIVCSIPKSNMPAVAHQNVYVVIPKIKTISIQIWMAILNSKLLTFLYQNGLYGQKGRTMAQFRVYALDALPFPQNIAFPLLKKIEIKINLILSNREQKTFIEDQIDRLVYQLYGLTNAEVKVIDPDAKTNGEDNELFQP